MPKRWYVFCAKEKNRGDKVRAIFSAAVFLICAWADAQSVDLTVLPEAPVRQITKGAGGDQVQLGDRIPLNVEIRGEWIKGDAQFKLTVPEGSSKLSELGWYLDPNNLWVAGNVRIVVSPLKSGKQTLPTLVVYSKDQDFVAIARTQPITLNVTAPQKEQGAKVDLLDPQTISLPTKFILLGIAGLMALAAVIVFLIRKFKAKLKPLVQTPPLKIDEPEHVIAMKRLETLFGDNPHSSEAAKPVAFGISEILKDFFSKRFKVEAAESTTSEMLGLLRSVGMQSAELREISDFFEELDRIKFLKREHSGPYPMDKHQHFKVKSMALVQRWARQITPAQATAPAPKETR